MIHVLASIEIKAGERDTFLKIFKENVPNVLAEKGCIEYQPAVDNDIGVEVQSLNANRVVVVEKWASENDLQNHFEAPHMKAYKEKVAGLVESVSLQILRNAD